MYFFSLFIFSWRPRTLTALLKYYLLRPCRAHPPRQCHNLILVLVHLPGTQSYLELATHHLIPINFHRVINFVLFFELAYAISCIHGSCHACHMPFHELVVNFNLLFEILGSDSRSSSAQRTISMASQDLISQVTQEIPASQPDSSHSRTPRRTTDHLGQVPSLWHFGIVAL